MEGEPEAQGWRIRDGRTVALAARSRKGGQAGDHALHPQRARARFRAPSRSSRAARSSPSDEGPRAGDTQVLAVRPLRQTDRRRLATVRETSGRCGERSSWRAKRHERFNLQLGRFLSFAVARVPPEIMGIGQGTIPKVLKQIGLKLSLDWIELNRSASPPRASQSAISAADSKVNPLGGAEIFGHPLSATGAIHGNHGLRRRGRSTYGHDVHRHRDGRRRPSFESFEMEFCRAVADSRGNRCGSPAAWASIFRPFVRPARASSTSPRTCAVARRNCSLFRTRNLHGTLFGGRDVCGDRSAVRPSRQGRPLGPGYIIWDKTGAIRYKKPGRSTLYAECS